MNRFIAVFIFALSLFTLSACSMFGAEEIDYRDSEITPTLEIPPDLIQSQEGKNLPLPGSRVGMDSNTGRYVETGDLNIESRTLPNIDRFEIQGEGDLHWLSVPYSAQKTYPLLREFWSEQGFELVLDEPIMGMMRTQWIRSRASNASFFGKTRERASGAESRHQFTTRLQRFADDASTLVFISHRQQDLVIKNDESGSAASDREGWQLRASDSTREYEMLSRLMVFMGLGDEAVKAQMEKLGGFAARATLQQGAEDGLVYLKVSDGFHQTWNRLLHQLSRLNVVPEESEREDNKGTLVINSSQLFTALQEQDRPERKSIILALVGHDNSDTTRIEVMDGKGSRERNSQARKILQSLSGLLK
jgi:outer membrane protein assembly factor BamC